MMSSIRELLNRLAYPISRIDRGCQVCIQDFIEDVNVVLMDMQIPFKYESSSESQDIKVVDARDSDGS